MAKYKRLYTQCLRQEIGADEWWDEDGDDVGYAVVHHHYLFGRWRQSILETDTGFLYNIPRGRVEEIMKLPTVMDMEFALGSDGECLNNVEVSDL